MADLNPLIRFRKHIVDEKQKVLSQLYRDAERIEQSKQIVLNQMEHEKDMAAEMATTEASMHLGRYLDGARKKIRALEISLKKMQARIEAAQEDVRAAFTEMKKIKIAQDRREEREAAAQDKKESNELDEIGIDRFRRKDD
jgi:flagellar export protein FliJ